MRASARGEINEVRNVIVSKYRHDIVTRDQKQIYKRSEVQSVQIPYSV